MQEGVWYGVVRNGRARFGLSGGGDDDLTAEHRCLRVDVAAHRAVPIAESQLLSHVWTFSTVC